MEKKLKQKKQEVEYAMPVAADEPTYCYCGDVSYGEMIACENEVWFLYDEADDSSARRNGFTWNVWDLLLHREENGGVAIVNQRVIMKDRGGKESVRRLCVYYLGYLVNRL